MNIHRYYCCFRVFSTIAQNGQKNREVRSSSPSTVEGRMMGFRTVGFQVKHARYVLGVFRQSGVEAPNQGKGSSHV